MKSKASAAAAAEDDAEPKKIRSSRSKGRRRRHSRSSSRSESPPRKRSKKNSKRIPDKKSKRSKGSGGSSRRRRHRSLSPSPSRSLSSKSSSPSLVGRRSCSSCSSSSASERSVSPPPRSRSRDVRRKKGRERGRERDRKGRKLRRSASSSSISTSSGSSRSKSRKRRTVGGTKDRATTTRDKMEKDYTDRRSSQSDMNVDGHVDRDEDRLAIAKVMDNDIDRHKKNLELESSPSKNANKTEEKVPASGGNLDAQDLELILRQKALENFRKFRAAATMVGKTDSGAAGKEALLDDSVHNAGTEAAEATHSQSQETSFGVRYSAGPPRSQNFGNGVNRSWKQDNSVGMSCGAGSPGLLEPAETGGPTQLKGRAVESTRLASQFLSPQDARNGRSVMQRLAPPPGSSASVNQRLGSSAGLNHVNGVPRVRSVVSIPARERLDGSTRTTPLRPSEDSSPAESSGKAGLPLNDTSKVEGTNGENTKTSEASASDGSLLSPTEDKSQASTEGKDSFQKKTFSRMHDGETVEVSYKVYIPKRTPALARRKLQR